MAENEQTFTTVIDGVTRTFVAKPLAPRTRDERFRDNALDKCKGCALDAFTTTFPRKFICAMDSTKRPRCTAWMRADKTDIIWVDKE